MQFSLRTKLFALTTLLVTAIMFTVTYFFTYREVKARRQGVSAQMQQLARNVATVQLVNRQDWSAYQDYISQLLARNDDLVYIAVYDDRRSLRAHALNEELVAIEAEAPLARRARAEVVSQLDRGGVARDSRRDLQTEAVDIMTGDRVLGSVHVGFSLIAINDELLWGIQRNIAIAGAFLVLAGGLSFVLSRRLTGPLERLSRAMSAVAAGDLRQHVVVENRDEIGQLARTFNAMLEVLREREHLRSELEIARAVQRRLLPSAMPVVRGLDIDGVCLPAHEVAGDYFDFLPLPDGRLGVAVADVSGKGTSASFYMAELKGMMLGLAPLHPSPRELLIELNRGLYSSLERRVFATIVYAVVDPTSRSVSLARAGHQAVLLVRADARCSRLAPQGIALAIESGELFARMLEEWRLELGPGDVAILYTDGLSDAMNAAGETFGEPRLIDCVSDAAGEPAAKIRERVLRAVEAFCEGVPASDDRTLVVLKAEG